MYPELDNTATEFEQSAGMSITVLVKVKSFKYPMSGNYWSSFNYWTVSNIHGNLKDSDIEEWYYLPEIGTGYNPC